MVKSDIEAFRLEGVEFDHPKIFSFFQIIRYFFLSHVVCVPQLLDQCNLCVFFEVMVFVLKKVVVDWDGTSLFCVISVVIST